jgi:hypothetical protein
MKICTKCNIQKKKADFFKRKASKDGLNLWCKSCHVNNNNIWTEDNVEHVNKKKKEFYYANLTRVRNKELKHKFGITKDKYDEIHKSQNGLCKICGLPETSKGRSGNPKPLSVDHCHVSNIIRGLLCGKCNTGIGLLNDDIELLEKAIEYIKAARLGKGLPVGSQPTVPGRKSKSKKRNADGETI